MGGQFLSERDEIYRLSFFLRDQIRCGGIGQYVLRDSCPVYGARVVRKDPARLHFRGEGATSHHARKGAGWLRRRSQDLSECYGWPWRKARSATFSVWQVQEFIFQEPS